MNQRFSKISRSLLLIKLQKRCRWFFFGFYIKASDIMPWLAYSNTPRLNENGIFFSIPNTIFQEHGKQNSILLEGFKFAKN